jgi:RNA polymerase subunit RPABC4/transcription elongation factor Spt4
MARRSLEDRVSVARCAATTMRPVAVALVAASLSAVGAPLATVRADGPYEGTWRAGPMRIDVTIESWGPDCGQQPRSVTSREGGTVRVEQLGDHLVFRGPRVLRTDECWSENRAIRKVSSSAQAGAWRTLCRTAPGDSRGETGTYTVRASGGDTLELRDSSEYDWSLNQSVCKAKLTTTQTLTRVRDVPVTAPPPPPPTDEGPAGCRPGAPAKLTLRPPRVVIEPGERVCFRARLADAAGCAIAGATIAWLLERPASRTGELSDGCFQAAEGPAALGDFAVIATSGGLRDRAVVSVRTRDLSDLVARRGEVGMLGALTGGGTASTEDATGLRASTGGADRGPALLWPLLGLSAALFLLGLGGLALVRGRRKRGAAGSSEDGVDLDEGGAGERPASANRTPPGVQAQGFARATPTATAAGNAAAGTPVASVRPPARPPRNCPVCHREMPGDTAFCPYDGATLVSAPSTAPVAPSQAKICPTCRRGYPPEARFCPADADELIPYALWAARGREAVAGEKPRICPKCGTRYPSAIRFCGKDGAALETVN